MSAAILLFWLPILISCAALTWTAISARNLILVIGMGFAVGVTLISFCAILAVFWFSGGLFTAGTGNVNDGLEPLVKIMPIVSICVLAIYFPTAVIRWGLKKDNADSVPTPSTPQ